MTAVREVVLTCGPAGTNVGVLTLSPAPNPRVGAVLLNPGLVHRIGNGRFNVRLARELAAAGVPALRFDFSGIGDSPRREGVPRTMASAVEEVAAAVATLRERTGVSEVVLYGLCGGADVGQSAAVSIPEVVGLALVDPWVYRTARYWMHRAARLVSHPITTASAIGRYLVRGRRTPPEDAKRSAPPRLTVERDLQTLITRKVALFVCFTGGYRDRYVYHGQYRECFPKVQFGERLKKQWLHDADHLLTSPTQQRILLDGVITLAHSVAKERALAMG